MKSTTQAIEITPALLQTLRAAINAALNPVGEPHGVTLSLGNISYNEAEATGRLVITAVGANVYAVDFPIIAHFHGLLPSDLGRKIRVDGESYTIHGIKGSGKRPLVLRRADGALFQFPEQSVIQALGLPWPLPMWATFSPSDTAEWRANPTPALGLAETVEIRRKIDAANVSKDDDAWREAMILRKQVASEVEDQAKALISKMSEKASSPRSRPPREGKRASTRGAAGKD